jgi:hypothetical protein
MKRLTLHRIASSLLLPSFACMVFTSMGLYFYKGFTQTPNKFF